MKIAVAGILLAGFFIVIACQPQEPSPPAGRDGWLKGTLPEKHEIIAGQFRGLDVAMVETGYRYQELYWAGQDQNWEYAAYQLEKIGTVIKTALVRRPKRAPSAEPFLNEVLPEVQKAIDSRDTLAFRVSFQFLTTKCNACHDKEKVPFFKVRTPVVRQSPIGG